MLGAPAPVLNVIQNGYVLPLMSVPNVFRSPNQKSAVENFDFVQRSIVELVENGCVRECTSVPHVCSPLLVVTSSSGKKRLVINLRYVNRFLWKDKFKYDDMRIALTYFEQGGYLATFDLTSGYHHIDVHEDSQTYLGFEWCNRFYSFTVLPFGLASACYLFTKMLRPLVKFWRGQGIKVVMYIDDGIVTAADFDRANAASHTVQESLARAGFVTNVSKSHWKPSQQGRWLGLNINLDEGTLSIPTGKIAKLKCSVAAILESGIAPAKLIASVIGRIVSMSLGIGPIGRFRTRGLYRLLNSRSSWYEVIALQGKN